VAQRIAQLLSDPSYTQQAELVAGTLAGENGPQAACDALEQLLSRKQAGRSS